MKDEHGNPIIEISEEIKDEPLRSALKPIVLIDQPIRPLWEMTPSEAAAKRLAIAAMWEALEEEEQEDETRKKRRRRSPSPTKNSESEKLSTQQSTSNPSSQPLSKNQSHKKSVTFEDGSIPGKVDIPTVDWGDVVPARLKKKIPLRAGTDSNIMKFDVIEKWDGHATQTPLVDSDDEDLEPQKYEAEQPHSNREPSTHADQELEVQLSDEFGNESESGRQPKPSHHSRNERVVHEIIVNGVDSPHARDTKGKLPKDLWEREVGTLAPKQA